MLGIHHMSPKEHEIHDFIEPVTKVEVKHIKNMKSYDIQGQRILTLDFTSERTGTLYASLKVNIRLFRDWSDRTA